MHSSSRVAGEVIHLHKRVGTVLNLNIFCFYVGNVEITDSRLDNSVCPADCALFLL